MVSRLMDREKRAIIQQFKKCKNGEGEKSGLWYFVLYYS